MNDFLSKFSKDKYHDTLEEQKQKKIEETPTPHKEVTIPTEESEEVPPKKAPSVQQEVHVPTEAEETVIEPEESKPELVRTPQVEKETPPPPEEKRVISPKNQERDEAFQKWMEEQDSKIESRRPRTRRDEFVEETVTDPTYKKKKRRQIIVGSIVGLLLLLLLFFLYFRMTRVTIPNFEGKTITEAKQWGQKNKVEFLAEQVFSTEHGMNIIVSQEKSGGSRVKKGSSVSVVVSKGADPEEKLPLPDFEAMDEREAQEWIETNKADNLTITRQYSDTVDAGKYIKLEMRDKSLKAEDYRRRDIAIVYYSRGEEAYEKNITVPSFTGKLKEEVVTWAKSNEVEVTYKEADSDSIPSGAIVSQSVSAGEKISKKDPLTVTVSLGEAIIVPNFSYYTSETASNFPGLTYLIQTKYSSRVNYGFLISQSIPSGTKLTDKDNKGIHLVYSLGLPYLDDLRGKMNEGELQKYFFEEYQSKGADVDYIVEYVHSEQPRGTIIGQSNYSTLIGLDYRVKFYISIGDGPDMADRPSTDPDDIKD